MSPSHSDDSPLPPALVEAWRADRAWPSELRRDYARFLRHRRGAGGSRLGSVARWVGAGLVVGVGLAQAAALAPWSTSEARGPAVVVATSASASPPSPHRELVRGPVPLATSADEATSAPSLAFAPPPPARPSGIAPPSPRSSAAQLQARWAEAAAALRAGDFTRAEGALLAIEASTSGGPQDAARLARAQLLGSHGRAGEARRIAEALRDHAVSPLVREQARALLESGRQIDQKDRSPAAAEDTQ